MKRIIILLPFLFTLVSLLQLNYVGAIAVSPDQMLRPLVTLWVLLCLLLRPAYWLTGSWQRAALLLTIFVLGFFFSSDLFASVLAFASIAAVCWWAFARLRRKKFDLQSVTSIFAALSLFFLSYAVFSTGNMLGHIPWSRYRQDVARARNYSIQAVVSPAIKPDIYYIVLDGYARADTLREMFHYDNSEFVTYLESKGFIVPTSNHSNYPSTPLSIASTLNMEYIQTLAPSLGQNYQRWLMEPFIDHSRLRAVLESQGYGTVSLSTNWSISDNPTTDAYFHARPVMLNTFEGFVLGQTPLQMFEPVLGTISSLPTAESHREVVRYEFETLSTLPELESPKFVFAHIISPHPPFVFDKNGNALPPSYGFTFKDANEFPGAAQDYPTLYVGQVQFVNAQVKKVIDAILAKSTTPPIIVIQADHGSGILTDFTSAANTCIHQRFSPFAAYYLPGVDHGAIPADFSNVNIFRVVLNEYFHADLSLLENRQYFPKDILGFYDFADVSDRVNESCSKP